MYTKCYSFFRLAVCAVVALLFNAEVFASHMVGADLYYTHVSGNTYKVTFVAYGNCGAASAAAFSTLPTSTPQICIYNGDSLITSVSLAIDTPSAGVEVTPLCPGDTSQCMNTTSVIPGIKKFVYSGNVTLPYSSATWRFIYTGAMGPGSAAGRASSITNISSAGATIMYLVDTLNNVASPNSSTQLTVAQQTFFCLGALNDYSPSPVDPDGDSLTFALVPAVTSISTATCDSPGVAVTYISGTSFPGQPISGAFPLQSVDPAFSVNANNGEVLFTPTIMQRSVVVYNIEERRGGVLVGTSQREMTVVVMTCGTGFPCLSTTKVPEVQGRVNTVTIYPNPAYDELTIKMDNGSYRSLTISNSIGQQVIGGQMLSSQTRIDIKALPAGVYYVTFTGDAGTQVQKFVKW